MREGDMCYKDDNILSWAVLINFVFSKNKFKIIPDHSKRYNEAKDLAVIHMITLEDYYVYIATNKYNTVFYIGMTNNLVRRMHEHKIGKFKNAFTLKYKIHKLVYFEKLNNKHKAANREKQLKGLLRSKKLELIKSFNPKFRDLSEMWQLPTGEILRSND